MYIIIKHMKNKKTGKTLPVILLNGLSEILEYQKVDEAQKLCDLLNTNSDSGHVYTVKKI